MIYIRPFFAAFALAVALSTAPAPAAVAEPAVYTAPFSKLAVQGYDAVAYFESGKPVKGLAEYTVMHQGAEFRFANAAHRDLFKADPQKYAPQYGGYCAWAVSQGYHAKGDARFWSIENGKLYLNYNAKVQSDWDKDRKGFIAKSDQQWPLINR
jgi:YHS domain-containing protein